MVFVVLLLALLVAVSAALYLYEGWLSYRFFRLERSVADPEPSPASILIPVCGLEEHAEENWSSFCRQDYPGYEVLFGVMDPADAAVPSLRRLAERYPERVRLVIGLPPLGANHQISNLIHLRRAARNDRLVISDSDMRVRPDYLRRICAPLSDPGVGIVTAGYLDHAPESLGAALAALGRGLEFLPQVLLARKIDGGQRFALGATIALRRDVLHAMGGLEAVVNRIGSDFHLGRLASEAGYRVELSTYLLDNSVRREPVAQVFRRELRWARTIRMNRGPQYYGLGATYTTVWALLLLALAGSQPWAAGMAAAALALRGVQGLLVIHSLRCPGLYRWAWALPLRDFLSFGVWAVSLLGNDVHWRGRRLTLYPGGVIREPV